MSKSDESIFDELESAIALLKEQFLSTKNVEVDELLMVRKGLVAMLETLQDPFTNYIPPTQLETYKSRKVETVVGIGLQLEQDTNENYIVVSPIIGGPADTDVLAPGTSVIAIDGKKTRGRNVQQVNKLLAGAEGTSTEITTQDKQGNEIQTTIKRAPVDVDYLRFEQLDDGILFARVAWFSGTCHKQFLESVKHHASEGARGLVLDIRNNSGGSIIATRNIFSSLCDEKVMYFGMRKGVDNAEDRALGEFRFSMPVAVLINHATFSAGEVLAGALKDYSRAKIVGVRSGGKGSMQQVFPLEGQIGGALRITTATNCTPAGNILQGNGVEPDIVIDQICPELFVDEGPQNIYPEGRQILKQIRKRRLVAKYGQDKIEKVWRKGDLQLKYALQSLLDEIPVNS